MARRKRVLFFAEAVTLAHVARPLALAGCLDPDAYDVTFACSPRQSRFLEGSTWTNVPLDSIESAQFVRALARGSPVYELPTLRRYLRDDLSLIERVKPDLVVGDFRLSLSVSCRLGRVPYAAVTNAYWSPFYRGGRYPLPVLPMTRWLPLPLARALFAAARPIAFPLHCRPLNRLRVENGLPSLGNDLRRIYTDADHVLYADPAGLFETPALPSWHHCIGPLLWSPPVAPPPWWSELPAGLPIVYVTLGSSGDADVLRSVLHALGDRPLTVIASTAGMSMPERFAPNVHVADYLPGTAAAARAEVVVCNGGSPTSQQALAAGVPVVGVAANMDQFLNMNGICARGAGILLRSDRLGPGRIVGAIERLLATPSWARQAKAVFGEEGPGRTEQRFRIWLATALAQPSNQQLGV